MSQDLYEDKGRGKRKKKQLPFPKEMPFPSEFFTEEGASGGSVGGGGSATGGAVTAPTAPKIPVVAKEPLEAQKMVSEVPELEGVGPHKIENKIESQGGTVAPVGEDRPKRMGLDEIYRVLSEKAPESEEERARREKREKRLKTFTALQSGLQALGNLYFTSTGGLSSFDPKHSATRELGERYKELEREREANKERWLSAQARLARMEEEDRSYKRQLEAHRERERRAEAEARRREAAAKQAEEIHHYKKQQARAQAEKAQAEAKWAEPRYKAQAERSGRGGASVGATRRAEELHKYRLRQAEAKAKKAEAEVGGVVPQSRKSGRKGGVITPQGGGEAWRIPMALSEWQSAPRGEKSKGGSKEPTQAKKKRSINDL